MTEVTKVSPITLYQSSPNLSCFRGIMYCGIYATGTLRVDRKDVPKDVKELKEALGGRKVVLATTYEMEILSMFAGEIVDLY